MPLLPATSVIALCLFLSFFYVWCFPLLLLSRLYMFMKAYSYALSPYSLLIPLCLSLYLILHSSIIYLPYPHFLCLYTFSSAPYSFLLSLSPSLSIIFNIFFILCYVIWAQILLCLLSLTFGFPFTSLSVSFLYFFSLNCFYLFSTLTFLLSLSLFLLGISSHIFLCSSTSFLVLLHSVLYYSFLPRHIPFSPPLSFFPSLLFTLQLPLSLSSTLPTLLLSFPPPPLLIFTFFYLNSILMLCILIIRPVIIANYARNKSQIMRLIAWQRQALILYICMQRIYLTYNTLYSSFGSAANALRI